MRSGARPLAVVGLENDELQIMNSENKIYEIRKISQFFSIQIIELVRLFPKDPASYVVGNQIIRSATSISANIVEAQSSLTKKEFIYYLNVAKKEAKETLNWLEIIEKAKLNKNDISALIEECNEIISILVASVKKSQTNS